MTTHNLIILTGASGWLGKRFVKLLAGGEFGRPDLNDAARNSRLRCLVFPGEDDKEICALGPKVEILSGDLRNAEICDRLCDQASGALLFHTAGVIHPRRVKDFYDVNVEGTRKLLGAAARAGVRRMVAVSSNSPAGCNPHRDHLFDELSPYHPYMNYGRSKMMMELAVKEADQQDRLETVIVRPPWFYGPDQPPRQSLFFSMIRQGKAPIVGSGNNLRSMAYIDNLCQGLLLAGIVAGAKGQTYWIADRRPYSMNEIIDTIERLLEEEFNLSVQHKRMRLPSMASEVALLADGTLQGLGLYHSKIHVLSEMNKTIACSIAKAERELGYDPQIALEEGMRRSVEWCLERGIKI
jgi:nucleoside-diphosphate-sugar epimerase